MNPFTLPPPPPPSPPPPQRRSTGGWAGDWSAGPHASSAWARSAEATVATDPKGAAAFETATGATGATGATAAPTVAPSVAPPVEPMAVSAARRAREATGAAWATREQASPTHFGLSQCNLPSHPHFLE